MKKTLFLGPPSFEGFDGGAGARYQAKREITSYWYPTWLAQPAALVPGSKLVDAPPHHLSVDDVLAIAKDYELVIIGTPLNMASHPRPSFPTSCSYSTTVSAMRSKTCITGKTYSLHLRY